MEPTYSQPLEVFVLNRREWQGSQAYYPGRNDLPFQVLLKIVAPHKILIRTEEQFSNSTMKFVRADENMAEGNVQKIGYIDTVRWSLAINRLVPARVWFVTIHSDARKYIGTFERLFLLPLENQVLLLGKFDVAFP